MASAAWSSNTSNTNRTKVHVGTNPHNSCHSISQGQDTYQFSRGLRNDKHNSQYTRTPKSTVELTFRVLARPTPARDSIQDANAGLEEGKREVRIVLSGLVIVDGDRHLDHKDN